MPEYFDGKMRRGSEAEEADAVSRVHFGDTQATEANDAGTEQRGQIGGVRLSGERNKKVGAGDSVLGVSPIHGVAGERGVIA